MKKAVLLFISMFASSAFAGYGVGSKVIIPPQGRWDAQHCTVIATNEAGDLLLMNRYNGNQILIKCSDVKGLLQGSLDQSGEIRSVEKAELKNVPKEILQALIDEA